jgi:hypothetical protein
MFGVRPSSDFRVTVWCAECGGRNPLERRKMDGELVYLICTDCEKPIKAIVSAATPRMARNA